MTATRYEAFGSPAQGWAIWDTAEDRLVCTAQDELRALFLVEALNGPVVPSGYRSAQIARVVPGHGLRLKIEGVHEATKWLMITNHEAARIAEVLHESDAS